MPELPEVECLSRAVSLEICGWQLHEAKFHRKDLRDPIPVRAFRRALHGRSVERVSRRSKYMLWHTSGGVGLFHLGMSGNLFVEDCPEPLRKHTHAVFEFRREKERKFLHFVDPRRFGRIGLLDESELETHAYFRNLGPEPLESARLADHLYQKSRGRKVPVKNFIMDAHVVVGVGNIYASESLFNSRIHPSLRAGELDLACYRRIAREIKTVLRKAIKAGGTSIKDFRGADGEPGYFRLELNAYGRSGEPCRKCENLISQMRHSGRSTYFCSHCQPC